MSESDLAAQLQQAQETIATLTTEISTHDKRWHDNELQRKEGEKQAFQYTTLRSSLQALRDEMRATTGENPIGPLYGAGYVAAARACADQVDRLLTETQARPKIDRPPVPSA